jgi:hypothetical protein
LAPVPLREIEEGQLVASAHIEKDMRGSRFVAILDDFGQAHAKHLGIKANRRFEVRTNQR